MRRVVVILSVLCGLSLAGCGEPKANRPSPPAVASPGSRPPAAGDHRLTLDVDGKRRTYLLHAPPGYDGDRPVPLVVGLHFYPGSGAALRDLIGLDAKADEHGFLVAYPDGTNGGFNALICCGAEDDVAFLTALTERLIAEWRVDPDRVYLTGISNGGDMSFRAAVEAAGVFAAIGVVSGGLGGARAAAAGFVPERPVSVVTIIGAQDRYFDDFRTGLTRWQRRLSCVPVSGRPGGPAGVRRSSARCADGSDVEVYVVAGMGHSWPGAASGQLAAPDAPIVATDIVWDFFAAHPRRR
ncbi:polyhydroxybutyrate depolymerase [Actinoplanes sp. ATCC 53533]|uniref:alpha/beta hydrolase family esterase n=1 Tax=Actinoplanes sp. ATCC 53533 TaxID=1288362 RepID=UPI000F79834B|nr:PHB depolymerase family esterase [Actinoplanes sp. ATCC 53533]RSM74216.1 polyhydroxybutyrate depolymerase [Actinoplanes sp. ATCC 53533]